MIHSGYGQLEFEVAPQNTDCVYDIDLNAFKVEKDP